MVHNIELEYSDYFKYRDSVVNKEFAIEEQVRAAGNKEFYANEG
jgi:ACT domain-containing protein